MEGKNFQSIWVLFWVFLSPPASFIIVLFWSQVEILAREYLQSLTEPTEEPENTEIEEVPVRCF